MAAKVTFKERFCSAYEGFISLEKTKGALGRTFHEAVIMLLNENPGKTGKELVSVFLETMTEVENTLMAKLKEAFGDDATPDMLGDWKQCKSDYKRALELVHRSDLMKCTGWHQVRTKKAEVLKAMKEKANSGLDDSSEGNSANEKGANEVKVSGLDVSKIPKSALTFLKEGLRALEGLSEAEVTEVVLNFKRAAQKMRRLKLAKPHSAAATTGSAEKVAANS